MATGKWFPSVQENRFQYNGVNNWIDDLLGIPFALCLGNCGGMYT